MKSVCKTLKILTVMTVGQTNSPLFSGKLVKLSSSMMLPFALQMHAHEVP